MNEKEISAFEHSSITEFYKLVTEYHFYLGTEDDPVKIAVSIYETDRGKFTYATSHNIRTPIQAGPYTSSIRSAATPEAALAKAIDDLTSFYDSAVSQGHNPSSDWFVPSISYRSYG